MHIASYGAIIFSIGATIMSLFLIDRLGGLPMYSSQKFHGTPSEGYVPQDFDLIGEFSGAGQTWKFMFWHRMCLELHRTLLQDLT